MGAKDKVAELGVGKHKISFGRIIR
jgi:hypothetical protein